MTAIALTFIASLWPASAQTQPASQSQPVVETYGPHVFAAVSETALVRECSGVIASRRHPDVFWVHNDSGAAQPRVWAFRLAASDRACHIAKHLGYVELTGASDGDWEDIAAGPGGEIYVLDGGDNPPCRRTGKHIHRFIEPAVEPDGPPIALRCRFDSIRFEYPGSVHPSQPADSEPERYDAECLLVDPATGDIYVVTKRNAQNAATARVYKLPAGDISWNSDRCHTLTFVVDLSSPMLNMVTGGDVDPTGRRVVLRNYLGAFEYTLPAGEPFEHIFRQTPHILSFAGEAVRLLQGEGICYDRDGRDLITTTEAPRGDQHFRVFITPRLAWPPAAGSCPATAASRE